MGGVPTLLAPPPGPVCHIVTLARIAYKPGLSMEKLSNKSIFVFLLCHNPSRAITRCVNANTTSKPAGNSGGLPGFAATLWATTDKLRGK